MVRVGLCLGLGFERMFLYTGKTLGFALSSARDYPPKYRPEAHRGIMP